MRFDIYGRYTLEVVRDADAWVVYRKDGTKRRSANLVIPPDLTADAIPTYLDDMLHEQARPRRPYPPIAVAP